jgi:hypothetical protein
MTETGNMPNRIKSAPRASHRSLKACLPGLVGPKAAAGHSTWNGLPASANLAAARAWCRRAHNTKRQGRCRGVAAQA